MREIVLEILYIIMKSYLKKLKANKKGQTTALDVCLEQCDTFMLKGKKWAGK